MGTPSTLARTDPSPAARRRWWPDRTGYLAAGWAGVYGTVALVWTVTGAGFPFGRDDPHREASLLRELSAGVAAPLFAAVLLATAVAMLAMAGPHAVRLRGLPRLLLLGWAYAVAAGLAVVVPDVSLLTLAGYAPMLIIGAPFGWPPVDYAAVFTWSLGNKALCLLGGLLVARAAVTWQRRTAGGCLSCGRRPADDGTAAAALRWGRRAVYVAVVVPVLYAVTRFAWLAGVPLGLSTDDLRALRDSGGVWAGAGLGAFAVVGAVLTLGLVQRWGEVFPRWMIGLAGRRVPVRLATVPATLVAVLVTAGGLALLSAPVFVDKLSTEPAIVMPMLLWPVWGAALALAGYAYHLRRRGACPRCGRGG